MQDFVSPIKGCLEADTGLFCGLPQAHSMNHADDILAELITLLDVCNAGLGDIGESLLAAYALVPPMMIVGSVPTNGVASTMHTVRKFLGALTPLISWLHDRSKLELAHGKVCSRWSCAQCLALPCSLTSGILMICPSFLLHFGLFFCCSREV